MSRIYSSDPYCTIHHLIKEYLDTSYYGDCIVKFELSYNGAEWDTMKEIALLDEDFNVYFVNDWCEGQHYIRNVTIQHIDELTITGEVLYSE